MIVSDVSESLKRKQNGGIVLWLVHQQENSETQEHPFTRQLMSKYLLFRRT